MKGKLISTAQVAVAAFAMSGASVAFAQSSVTLYGILDAGIEYNSNSGGKDLVQYASRHVPQFFGLSGQEDLGGGESAFFRYTQTIATANGVAGPKESYVGLADTSFGRVSLGRQYDLIADLLPYFSEYYMSVSGVHPGDFDRSAGTYLNNAIKYRTPVYHGFSGALMFSFGETGTGATNAGNSQGIELDYNDNQSLRATVVYLNVRGVTATPFNSLGVTSLYGSTFAPGATVLQNESILAVGGYYDWQTWRLMATYTNTRLTPPDRADAETIETYDVGANKSLSPSLSVGAGYSYSKLESYKWNIWHAHVDYFLSKSTDLYLRVVQESAGAGQHAVLFLENPSSNSRQLVVGGGITHRF